MSDDPTKTLEERVGAALHAEVDGLTPGGDSLGTIRGRARVARHRRRVVAGVGVAVVVGAVALSIPAVRDDRTDVSTRSDPVPSTTTTPPPSTTTTEPPPATTVAPDLDAAVWPDPGGELFDDPVEATRSFLEVVLGVTDPPLGEFAPQGPDAGEVSVARRGEDGRRLGLASTVALRRLDGVHWFVTGAEEPVSMRIDAPVPTADVTSPLTVTGVGTGYEGTVAVELRSRSSAAELLADEVTIAGASEPEAFSVDLTFVAPSQVAVLVAHDDPGIEAGVPRFAALPVRLAAPSGEAATSGGTSGAGFELGSQPLWPFRSFAEAEAWRAAAAEGHQPWHADAAQTAALFTTSFLGFTEIDEVTSTDVRADEAWIGVGYREEAGGAPSTAAVVHLVRFGPHADSGWEVVGTRDTSLTLDIPGYGARTASPTAVGGTVTGVDECLVVQVRQPSTATPIGEAPCVPAGGESVPWQTTVAWSGGSDPALTIVVSTGGHVQGVERFALTGVPG